MKKSKNQVFQNQGPASAAAARALLGNSNGKSGFIGFGAFSDGTVHTPSIKSSMQSKANSKTASDNLCPFYTGPDEELALALKKLSKKDPTTRLKAIQKLNNLVCDSSRTSKVLRPALSHWVYSYNKVCLDNDRRIRESAQHVLSAFLLKCRRGLTGRHLPALIGSWWVVASDPVRDVKASARTAFEVAFASKTSTTESEIGEATIAMLYEQRNEILSTIRENIIAKPQTLSDLKTCTEADAERRYERIVVSSVRALILLLKTLSSEQNAALASLLPKEPKERNKNEINYASILNQKVAWSLLKHQRASFRRVCYQLLAIATQRLPNEKDGFLWNQVLELKGKGKTNRSLARRITSLPCDKATTNHNAMSIALLVFFRRYPHAWSSIHVENDLLPRLNIFFARGCYGSGASGFQMLLPLMNMAPLHFLEIKNVITDKDDSERLPLLFRAIWAGLDSADIGIIPQPRRGSNGDSMRIAKCNAWLLLDTYCRLTELVFRRFHSEEKRYQQTVEFSLLALTSALGALLQAGGKLAGLSYITLTGHCPNDEENDSLNSKEYACIARTISEISSLCQSNKLSSALWKYVENAVLMAFHQRESNLLQWNVQTPFDTSKGWERLLNETSCSIGRRTMRICSFLCSLANMQPKSSTSQVSKLAGNVFSLIITRVLNEEKTSADMEEMLQAAALLAGRFPRSVSNNNEQSVGDGLGSEMFFRKFILSSLRRVANLDSINTMDAQLQPLLALFCCHFQRLQMKGNSEVMDEELEGQWGRVLEIILNLSPWRAIRGCLALLRVMDSSGKRSADSTFDGIIWHSKLWQSEAFGKILEIAECAVSSDASHDKLRRSFFVRLLSGRHIRDEQVNAMEDRCTLLLSSALKMCTSASNSDIKDKQNKLCVALSSAWALMVTTHGISSEKGRRLLLPLFLLRCADARTEPIWDVVALEASECWKSLGFESTRMNYLYCEREEKGCLKQCGRKMLPEESLALVRCVAQSLSESLCYEAQVENSVPLTTSVGNFSIDVWTSQFVTTVFELCNDDIERRRTLWGHPSLIGSMEQWMHSHSLASHSSALYARMLRCIISIASDIGPWRVFCEIGRSNRSTNEEEKMDWMDEVPQWLLWELVFAQELYNEKKNVKNGAQLVNASSYFDDSFECALKAAHIFCGDDAGIIRKLLNPSCFSSVDVWRDWTKKLVGLAANRVIDANSQIGYLKHEAEFGSAAAVLKQILHIALPFSTKKTMESLEYSSICRGKLPLSTLMGESSSDEDIAELKEMEDSKAFDISEEDEDDGMVEDDIEDDEAFLAKCIVPVEECKKGDTLYYTNIHRGLVESPVTVLKVHRDPTGGIFFEIKLSDGKIIGTIPEKLKWNRDEKEEEKKHDLTSFRDRIVSFYREHAPAVLEETPEKIDRLLSKYSGMEKELMEALHKKYCVSKDNEEMDENEEAALKAAIAMSLGQSESGEKDNIKEEESEEKKFREEIESFYRTYAPEVLESDPEKASKLVRKYADSQSELMDALHVKYNVAKETKSENETISKEVLDVTKKEEIRIQLATNILSDVVPLYQQKLSDTEVDSYILVVYELLIESVMSHLQEGNLGQEMFTYWRSVCVDMMKKGKIVPWPFHALAALLRGSGQAVLLGCSEEWLHDEYTKVINDVLDITLLGNCMKRWNDSTLLMYPALAKVVSATWWCIAHVHGEKDDVRVAKLQNIASIVSEPSVFAKCLDKCNSNLSESLQLLIGLISLFPVYTRSLRRSAFEIFWERLNFNWSAQTLSEYAFVLLQVKVTTGCLFSLGNAVRSGMVLDDDEQSHVDDSKLTRSEIYRASIPDGIVFEIIEKVYNYILFPCSDIQTSSFGILQNINFHKVSGEQTDSIPSPLQSILSYKSLCNLQASELRRYLLCDMEECDESLNERFNEDDSDVSLLSTCEHLQHHVFGVSLAWLSLMRGAIDAPRGALIRSEINDFVSENDLLPIVLQQLCILWLLPNRSRNRRRRGRRGEKMTTTNSISLLNANEITDMDVLSLFPDSIEKMRNLAYVVLLETAHALPNLLRSWFTENQSKISRSKLSDFEAYVSAKITPALIRAELHAASEYAAGILDCGEEKEDGTGTIAVRGSSVSRAITATYSTEDCALEIVLQLGPSHPLSIPEILCEKRLGVKESTWRRWSLQIRRLLGGGESRRAVDAVDFWKKNLDQEFMGKEPCPICYNVIHSKHRTLPSRHCATCGMAFHSHCLYKWFQSSNKSSFPMCRSVM
eukprot:g2792.t1